MLPILVNGNLPFVSSPVAYRCKLHPAKKSLSDKPFRNVPKKLQSGFCEVVKSFIRKVKHKREIKHGAYYTFKPMNIKEVSLEKKSVTPKTPKTVVFPKTRMRMKLTQKLESIIEEKLESIDICFEEDECTCFHKHRLSEPVRRRNHLRRRECVSSEY